MFPKKKNKNKGVTLVELIVVLAILSLLILLVFPMFFFGNNTFVSGRTQSNIQSDIRYVSDVIRDRVRYATDLIIIDPFDPSTSDPNFNYIYLSSDKKSIKFQEGNNAPVDLISAAGSDVLFDIEFTKGTEVGTAVGYSNSVSTINSVNKVLAYNISGESALRNKHFDVGTQINLINLGSKIPDTAYIEGPIATPTDGAVPYGTTVTLSTSISGATIYYTLDGTNPNISSSEYVNPIYITTNTTIKAITVKDGMASSIAVYDYTISITPPTAGDVNIDGNKKAPNELTVTYTYNSPADPAIPQGSSIIKWYSSSNKDSINTGDKVLIHQSTYSVGDVTTRQYTTNSSDKNKYIYVEITPIDANGNAGSPVMNLSGFGKIN